MASSVTVKDIALAAAVSVVTVSRVLNNHENVNEETRQRVFKAAADLGYLNPRVPGRRKMQDEHELHEIGLFLDLGRSISSNPFWTHIVSGIESGARKADLKLVCRSITDLLLTPNIFISTLQKIDVDGILLVGQSDPTFVSLVQSIQVPLVLVDTDIPGYPVDAVLSDYFGGARQAIEYLISEGHTRIALISPPSTTAIYTVGLRVAGYRTALLNAGLAIDDQLHSCDVESVAVEDGYVACQQLLARKVPFSAIFCITDEMAIGAFKALHEAGLRVPEDVSVVGCDDIDMATHLTPALTTIRVHKEEMGVTAVHLLQARAADADAVAKTTTLKVELVKRNSVASRST